MKKPLTSRRSVLAAASLLALPVTVLAQRGNGKMATQSRPVAAFTGVALSVPAKVDVRTGPVDSVVMEGDENLLPLVETVVKDGTLEIRPIRRNLDIEPTALKVSVQARQLDHLAIGGSGSIAADSLQAAKLELEIGGSGSINIRDLRSEKVETAVGGSGSVRIGGGTARSMSVSIGGSGDVKAGDLRAEDAEVSIGGAGDASVWARKSLRVAIAGSGSVSYYGDPIVRSSVVGSGRLRRLGESPR